MLKNKISKKAFTLIELLVVITIIGILATGGVAIFTKQLQASRDATRIGDLKLMETAVNLYFSDKDEFPDQNSFSGAVQPYMSKKLRDRRAGKPVCWGVDSSSVKTHDYQCGGYYVLSDDEYGLSNSAFKMGILFEKEENLDNKSSSSGKDGDGGSDESFYEVFAGAGAGSGITVTAKKKINDVTFSPIANGGGAIVY